MLFSVDDLSPDNQEENQAVFDAATAKAAAKRQRTRLARIASGAALSGLLSGLRHGDTLHLIGAGVWDQHDLLDYLQTVTGPAACYICTWAVSGDGVARIAEMARQGRLTSVHSLVDPRTTTQKTDACAMLLSLGPLGVYKNHAKVYVLRSESAGISVVTSANLNRNPHMEAGVISHSREIADFHINWITRAIDRSPPFEDIKDEQKRNDGSRRKNTIRDR